MPIDSVHLSSHRRASSSPTGGLVFAPKDVRKSVPKPSADVSANAHTDDMLQRPITLLVVDDHATVRRGLRYRFELEDDLVVLGEAANGNEALDKLEQFDPDVVILDVEMPVMDGLSVAARLRADGRRARSVVLTVHDDSVTRARARASNVDQFVSKHTGAESLLSAIRQAGQAA